MAERSDFALMSIVAIVAIVGISVLMIGQGVTISTTPGGQPVVKKSFGQDFIGEGFRATQAEQAQGLQRYCRCIRPQPGGAEVIDAEWDPALTTEDVWNPPLMTGASGCGNIWVVSICQQDAGALDAFSEETRPAGQGE